MAEKPDHDPYRTLYCENFRCRVDNFEAGHPRENGECPGCNEQGRCVSCCEPMDRCDCVLFA